MNIRLVLNMLSSILLVEAASMLPSIAVAVVHGDGDELPLLYTALLILVLCLPLFLLCKPDNRKFRGREGFVVVALAWVFMSLFGALPFWFSGFFPSFADAFFESVSGFTTTGATVTVDFDRLTHGLAFWRSFTHWVGGMGVLVLTLALLPKISDRTSHLVRAESPGPSLSKIAPKMGDSAKILYIIYFILTFGEFLALLIAGMNPFDAAIHAMGTAGTGGFSNYADSVAHFQSPAIEAIMTVFMILFGVNFSIFYFIHSRSWKDLRENEELKWYLGIVGGSILLLSLFLLPVYGSFLTSFRYASFQTASIVSTSGFATCNFDLWPVNAKMLLLLLTFIGSCAGSTAGGMKVIRVIILFKQALREVRHTFQPRKVQTIRFDCKAVDEHMLHSIAVFAFSYVALVLLGAFALSLENRYDLITNFTASLTCVSNVGPGFGAVGPAGGFAGYGPFAKIVASFLMLAGRLELFPMLVLLHPSVWKQT